MIKKILGKNNCPHPPAQYKKKRPNKSNIVNLLAETFSQNSLSRNLNQKFQSNKLKEEK